MFFKFFIYFSVNKNVFKKVLVLANDKNDLIKVIRMISALLIKVVWFIRYVFFSIVLLRFVRPQICDCVKISLLCIFPSSVFLSKFFFFFLALKGYVYLTYWMSVSRLTEGLWCIAYITKNMSGAFDPKPT